MPINFRNFDRSDLEIFFQSVKGTKLEDKIKRELERRDAIACYAVQEQFRSDRLPDFNSDYLYKAKHLSLEFDVENLPFTWRSACFDSNNNSKGDFYIGLFGSDKSDLDNKWRHNLGYMSLLFQDDELRKNYEGTYNVVNYMINGIYKELDRCDGKIDSVEQLLVDLPEKEEIVRDKFSDVADYLWTVRREVFESRSSIGNQGLTLNRNKTKKKLSTSQKALIEAVAYGCSLEELEKGNYEGAKRLIYVPYGKVKK